MITMNCYATSVNTIAESDVGRGRNRNACIKVSFIIESNVVSCRWDGKVVKKIE
jgi:hypothetical protein